MTTIIDIDRFNLNAVQAGTKSSFSLRYTGPGTTISTLPVNVIKSTEPGPTLLIIAAVHGDEYEGVETIIRLFLALQPTDIRGALVLVPIAYMLSYDGVSRTTPEDGCNLAREFPGDPNGTITQRLAWHIQEKLIRHADFLLDLHSGGTNYAVPELVGYYHNDDDEVGRRSRAAAEAFGMEVVWGTRRQSPPAVQYRQLQSSAFHGCIPNASAADAFARRRRNTTVMAPTV
ncbi:hypothetical protein GCM10010911_06750 [Paenibacillus nasutitermitis]|uniref:Succinylglutamate desuccinylase/Aspartoacylase catalytic domain-containing protein n=1 Tax=Paenibacillus nasutitermitis TaxID=1652958 RepID=A0A916YMD9_9BACL|nr:hypothetical protein GCM10010911_06750 [Paenibacillus nasutitermitis]